MSPSARTDADTERARQIWAEYQREHDVPALVGKAVGIDPVSGRVWFGESATGIWRQRQAEGIDAPFHCVRVGFDCYLRKGKPRRLATLRCAVRPEDGSSTDARCDD